MNEEGERKPTYYSEQSTAIAVGILVAAIHVNKYFFFNFFFINLLKNNFIIRTLKNAGLVTVVSTPLNAGSAIREILQRPINEKVGHFYELIFGGFANNLNRNFIFF